VLTKRASCDTRSTASEMRACRVVLSRIELNWSTAMRSVRRREEETDWTLSEYIAAAKPRSANRRLKSGKPTTGLLCKYQFLDKTIEKTSGIVVQRHKVAECNEKFCKLCSQQLTSACNNSRNSEIDLSVREKPYACYKFNSAFANRGYTGRRVSLGVFSRSRPSISKRGIIYRVNNKLRSPFGRVAVECGQNSVASTLCGETISNCYSSALPTSKHVSDQRTVEGRRYVEGNANRGRNAAKQAGIQSRMCKYCNKVFKLLIDLRLHERRIHFNKKDFNEKQTRKSHVCTFCGKRWESSDTLVLHSRAHTGEKPFTCIACNAAFSLRFALENHSRSHTGERRYVCQVCGTTFKRYNNLKSHLKTHTGAEPYTCALCNATFSRKRYLVGHLNAHTSEKLCTCVYCRATAINKTGLLVHSKTSTSCRNCSNL